MVYDLKNLREKIEKKLVELLPKNSPKKLREAMKYSLLAGGKRLRPLLLLSSAIALGKKPENFLEPACALEYIHTYSLIHDDLPSMDNDNLRRGKPTCHIKFGEAIAILAGDSLLTHSFYILSKYPEKLKKSIRLKAIEMVSSFVGAEGLVGGQVLDLEGGNGEKELLKMHGLKTGKLIWLSCELGALYSNATKEDFKFLSNFGKKFGILFQIVDDLLDELCTAEELGKSPGKDKKLNKFTAVSFWGIEGSIKRIETFAGEIERGLKKFKGDVTLFKEILQRTLSKVYLKVKP